VTDPVLGELSPGQVRVRFCPSPTGDPHVGLVRTALFNWAFARHYGGTFVFRIEDTDVARDSQESYAALLDTLRWLELDWDEGPEVGGPVGPYRQSQRSDIYADVLQRLVDSDLVYESFSTPEEVAERRRSRGEDPKRGYDNADRHLDQEQRAALRAAGRAPVLRLRMPETDWEFSDLVRGDVRVTADSVPDFVVARSSGHPLYTLVNPVDDALMGITHVLRGEDLLSSTPRQLAMYQALDQVGIGSGPPRFGHLPFVMGEGNRKLSKRDPTSSFSQYRRRGFLPEGLRNYLALLGWAIAEDRDVFSTTEMVAAFDIRRVNPNPARFDVKKAEAINGQWVRRLDEGDFAERLVAYLRERGVLLPGEDSRESVVRAAAPLVHERTQVLEDASSMLGFLLVYGDDFAIEEGVLPTVESQQGQQVLESSLAVLEPLETWSSAEIEAELRRALLEGLELKPRRAFGPVRGAVTGRKVSPPLFESMQLLGREESLRRLRRAFSAAPAPAAEVSLDASAGSDQR
jgi:glutamyl-tRNA synthetase